MPCASYIGLGWAGGCGGGCLLGEYRPIDVFGVYLEYYGAIPKNCSSLLYSMEVFRRIVQNVDNLTAPEWRTDSMQGERTNRLE